MIGGSWFFALIKSLLNKCKNRGVVGKPISKEKMEVEMKFVTIDYEGKIYFPEEKKKKPLGDKDKCGFL